MRSGCENCDPANPKYNYTVQWMKKGKASRWENIGPANDGWAMQTGNTDPGGDSMFENINYCPWCGRELQPKEIES